MRSRHPLALLGAFFTLGVADAGRASAQISLQLVSSYAEPGLNPFGLAFDGTNMWWSNGSNLAREMTLNGALTGKTTTMPGGWSALAWDASRNQLVSKGINPGSVTWFDRYTAANQRSITSPVGGLVDGLDVDHGELWISGDVNDVERYAIDFSGVGSFTPIGAQPYLTGSFSGVERVDVASGSYVFTVNDGSSPRQLCANTLATRALIGCQDFVNQRYEDIAFDGRYLWAADFYGNKIDKFDVLGAGGGSIFNPVPEPSTIVLTAAGLCATAAAVRRRGKRQDV